MGEENIKVLVKSEKISARKKKRIVWAIAVLLVIAALAGLFIDYGSYKKGQEFGLESAVLSSAIGGSSWVNENDSYTEQCKDVYYKLDKRTYDFYVNGVKYDTSDVRKAENALRSAFYDVMETGGFDRFSSSNIADWFKYTNIVEYCFGYYGDHEVYKAYCITAVCCIAVFFSIAFTISANREAKKELIVYEDSVLCRVNPKKAKQVVFEDINNVDFGKDTLTLVGAGIKFKISNLTNAENIKSVIIEMKKTAQSKSGNPNIGSADELIKYKELLDSGVITQDEFDAKKKQILGL